MIVVHPNDISVGLNWSDVFQNDLPLKLEVGFGTGDFLIHLASQDLLCNYVGIEKLRRYVHKAKKKVEARSLNNVRLIHGEATSIIPQVFGRKKLKEVYINFPDPWPKRRHRMRRIVQPAFVAMLSGVLEEKGKVSMATDVGDYAWQMFYCMQECGVFRSLLSEKPFVYSLEGRFPTKYETEYKRQGKLIYYLLFQKEGNLEGA